LACFLKFLDQHNCVLHSVTENIEKRTRADSFNVSLLMALIKYERENVAAKTANKMLERAECGFWNEGNEPYDYINYPKV
jgi:DNA invertase Pin-like site-specific DNA recombinase